MNVELRPGKGVRLPRSIALDMIEKAQEELNATLESDEMPSEYMKAKFGDPESDDKYGMRWTISTANGSKGNEFRAAIVIRRTKQGEETTALDIREWYEAY